MTKQKVTYYEIWQLAEQVAAKVGRRYDAIVSVGRGGLVPARILAELLDVKAVDVIDVASYVGTIACQVKLDESEASIAYHKAKLAGKNVLIVDDCATTGNTLVEVSEFIAQNCDVNDFTLAVMFCNKHLSWNSLDSAVLVAGTEYDGADTWLVFPWEK